MTPDPREILNRQQLALKGLAAIIIGVAFCFLVGPTLVIAGLPVSSALAVMGLGLIVCIPGSITLAVADKRQP